MEVLVRCVPIRDKSILLISSHHSQEEWVLPKGGWENDETAEQAAKRETFEEAGVREMNSDNV